MPYYHISAMPDQVIEYLNCRPGRIYADCTLGGCGHAGMILKNILPDGLLIGIDQDKDAMKNAKEYLKPYESNIHLVHDNFVNLPAILSKLEIKRLDGILLDLGLSFHQLQASGRGFSFMKDEPLDMRMNIDSKIMAKDIINNKSEHELKQIFKKFGEERRAGRIAWKIVKIRAKEKIRSSKHLARIITEAIPGKARYNQKIHPATRVFMALRIAVNNELDRLKSFMKFVPGCLNPGGRLCVLSFHSLEDRIVKKQMKTLEKGCTCPPQFPSCTCGKKPVVRILTKKVKRPSEEEIQNNPMARSTKLRAMEKL